MKIINWIREEIELIRIMGFKLRIRYALGIAEEEKDFITIDEEDIADEIDVEGLTYDDLIAWREGGYGYIYIKGTNQIVGRCYATSLPF